MFSMVIAILLSNSVNHASVEHASSSSQVRPYVVCSEETKDCHGFLDESLSEALHSARVYGLKGTLYARPYVSGMTL